MSYQLISIHRSEFCFQHLLGDETPSVDFVHRTTKESFYMYTGNIFGIKTLCVKPCSRPVHGIVVWVRLFPFGLNPDTIPVIVKVLKVQRRLLGEIPGSNWIVRHLKTFWFENHNHKLGFVHKKVLCFPQILGLSGRVLRAACGGGGGIRKRKVREEKKPEMMEQRASSRLDWKVFFRFSSCGFLSPSK